MKSFFPPKAETAAAALVFVACRAAAGEVPQQPLPSSGCGHQYKKLPDGRTTYGMDDGGCFFCGEVVGDAETHKPSSFIPISGDDLAESCEAICDADPWCLAYTVGRPATFASQLHQYGKVSNCCLDRRRYPPELTVDARRTDDDGGRKTSCQHEVMCWTRYEKVAEGGAGGEEGPDASIAQGEQQCRRPPRLQERRLRGGGKEAWNSCVRTEAAVVYEEEDVEDKIEFIEDGCDHEDPKLAALLAEAHDQCKEEILIESMSVSMFVHSLGTYAYINVGSEDLLSDTPQASPVDDARPPRPTSETVKKLYQAENPSNATFGWGSSVKTEHAGALGGSYVDMGGKDSWIEFYDVDGGSGGPCHFVFRYSNGASSRVNRPCSAELNGEVIGTVLFPTTKSWKNWVYVDLSDQECRPGSNSLKLTAVTSAGGPNIDRLEVSMVVRMAEEL